MRCIICRRPSTSDLCDRCSHNYLYEKEYQFCRLNKKHLIHSHVRESRLRRVLNRMFSPKNIYEEVIFKDCINPKTGAALRYDFAVILDDAYFLIEFHGRQHYKYTKFFHKTKEEFSGQKYRDKIKKDFAAKNNIPLIIIPYTTAINKIMIEKYIIKNIPNNYIKRIEEAL